MKFSDIEQLPRAYYQVEIPWEHLESHLARWAEDTEGGAGLNLDPDYQRAHVWTPEQQTAYIEYMLQGGEVGRNIVFNCPGWQHGDRGVIELVDGKQRLEAVRGFLRDEVKAFDYLYSQFEGRLGYDLSFRFQVCTLKTRQEILSLYLNINAGGTPHTPEELSRVKQMLSSARPTQDRR